ncbi:barstar family protein [Spirosoma rigui]|uniref:barstar family protein n=1 Tax=Spirosoma rigui TaxID=564064 RepID=UPI0009B01F94|nr:barstar family protein [Spirosoma rigui]
MTVDLTNITSKVAFHHLLKQELHFPDWYGVSWDAFWDCIIAVVEMPIQVQLIHWQDFARQCPRDMEILNKIIQDYNETMAPRRIILA